MGKVFARLTANRQRHESRRVQVERELDGVQQKLDRLIDALTDDSLPADEIKSRLYLEKARKAALTAEPKELQLQPKGVDPGRWKVFHFSRYPERMSGSGPARDD